MGQIMYIIIFFGEFYVTDSYGDEELEALEDGSCDIVRMSDGRKLLTTGEWVDPPTKDNFHMRGDK